MRTTLIFLVALSTQSLFAFDFVFTPVCGWAYRYESYSMGVDKAYRQTNKQPAVMDTYCFELGFRQGQALLKHEEGRWCERAYNEGVRDGLKGISYGPIQSPSECYNLGTPVGLTLLSIQAREEFKTSSNTPCARAYTTGKKDAQNNAPMTIQRDNLQDHCYQTGYNDTLIYR